MPSSRGTEGLSLQDLPSFSSCIPLTRNKAAMSLSWECWADPVRKPPGAVGTSKKDGTGRDNVIARHEAKIALEAAGWGSWRWW